ncbi:hypothetical protein VTK26DRAFT_6854 [Humicola hyalothermophila]
MSASIPRTSDDQARTRISEGYAGQQRADKGVADLPKAEEREQASGTRDRTTAQENKGEGEAKTQKFKPSLPKWGLPKGAREAKTLGVSEKKADKASKKTGTTKVASEDPKDMADLRVVSTPEPLSAPRVDIIAIHDIDETLHKAWIYRKKPKHRASDSRAAYAPAGINSFDGEGGLGTAGRPAPGLLKSRQALSSAKRKAADDAGKSIEKWLALSTKQSGEEQPAPDTSGIQAPPYDHGSSDTYFPPVEEHDDSTILGMLASVPEDDDGVIEMQTPDNMVWRRRMRRKSTLPGEKRKFGRAGAITEEDKAPSNGEGGDGRRRDVPSDRQSSLDHGPERRVNWLSDPDMLPSAIQGARVMCYTYKGVEKVPSPWQYLGDLAHDLAERTNEKRTSDSIDYEKVPIVLVGLGFGALILQRAMISAMRWRDGAEIEPTIDPAMVAGIILLDAPSVSPDRDVWPRSRSQEAKRTWTRDWLGEAYDASGTPTGKIDTASTWFRFFISTSVFEVPIMWHYSPMVSTATKPSITPKNDQVLFVPKQSATAHRLSRFEGPNDIDYRSIVDNIKRSLIVKCSVTKSNKLAMCLADFLRDKFPVDLRDQRGRTALHAAIRAANPEAVKRLIYQGQASVTKKDNHGRSALNIAIQEAAWRTRRCGDSPDPDTQKLFTQMINLLMKNGARADEKDNDGMTPWSYAEGEQNQWIRRLKDKYLVIGSSSNTSGGMHIARQPLPGPQHEACNAFDMILAEVFLQKKRERLSEVLNFDLASVYDVVYRSTTSVSQILAASRPEQLGEDKVRCRWIHVPSNNEQWVHDIMIRMGIHDNSMGGQRHEGSRLIDRYMMPQAKRNKHFHIGVKYTHPEPKPRTNRYGSTDSAATVVLGSQDFPSPSPEELQSKQGSKSGKATSLPEGTRTEGDAIVVFMPILGFEKHRHRKYLTRAFQEADAAMKNARARESSPDSRPHLRPDAGVSRQRDREKGAESSDSGEESSSEKEISQIYPIDLAAARARAQIRAGREAQLLRGYLDSKRVKPVHCRRTLDQFSYYMLNSTEARDKSQVAYRWAKNPPVSAEAKDRPIIMVDQLWLWAFHDGTVITSCPNTWNGQEDFNLSDVIVKELRHNKDRPIIKSVEDLLHLILRTSVDFFQRKGPANCQFHECFQSSINNVSEQQGRLFDNFRHTTKRLHVGTLDPVERKKEIEFIFSLDEETELLVVIMDIQDELTIVKTILGQQHDVLEKLLRLYPKKAGEVADEDGEGTGTKAGLGKGELMVLQSLVQLLRDQTAPQGGARGQATPATPVAFGDVFQGGEGVQEGPGQKRSRLKGKEKEGDIFPRPTVAPAKTNILQNRDLMYETIGDCGEQPPNCDRYAGVCTEGGELASEPP